MLNILKIKSPLKLVASILLSQGAGFVGTFFTISAIPTWYALLNKPSFSPPNWLFGPVWTILYTLIGISLYLIWINKKGSLKLFLFHLFLNAIWSPIFFGAKNLGLAFFVIILMDITLIIIIKNFYKVNKVAGIILIPYLMWISFASLLNLSIWKLNPQNTVKNIFAQDFTFTKAREDYVFVQDNYNKDLFDYNLKRATYLKNPTLSLKEEFRVSLKKFVSSRNNLIKTYLTMIRIKTLESKGIESSKKEEIYTKIDTEVGWYGSRNNSYSENDTVEDIINKSKEEDTRYSAETLPAIHLTLAQISLGELKSTKEEHIKIYSNLKGESSKLVELGRVDASVFDRWFKDIDNELNILSKVEASTNSEMQKIFGEDDYGRSAAYKKTIETLEPGKTSLLQLNKFIRELEVIIGNKR